MRFVKGFMLAAIGAMGLTSFGAATASATTLEVGGVKKNESVAFSISLKSGGSALLKDTSWLVSIDTCGGMTMAGSTSKFSAEKVTGALTELTFVSCDERFTVHNPGRLIFEHIPGTTNARVYSEETEVTWFPSVYPEGLSCKTGTETLLGILTGTASGHAVLHVNSAVACDFMTSIKWTGTYTITSPTGLGVSE